MAELDISIAARRPGFIYFIQEADSSPGRFAGFKIGMSDNVSRRLAELQTGNPRELVCYKFVKSSNMAIDEAYLHKKYVAKRVHGEWFALAAEEVDAECAHMESWLTPA